MKISFAISYEKTMFEAVGAGDFEESLHSMKKKGYDGVEIAIKNPDVTSVISLKKILDKHGLDLSAIGTGQAFVDEGLSLIDFDNAIRKQAIKRIKGHIDLASDFGAQVIIGLIRGKIRRLKDREKQIRFLKSALNELGTYANKKEVFLTIEPVNRYECNFLNTCEEVMDLISELDKSNIKILLDTFHMNIEERDMYETIVSAKDHLSHIHIADSNRKYPGMGHIDFPRILNGLKSVNYKGFISGEMLPYPDLETAMEQYIISIKEIING